MTNRGYGRPTRAQKRVLDYVRRHVARHGMPPTLREIGEALGFASTNAVASHLDILERKGLIERVPGRSRGIRLRGDRGVRGMVPVIGRIAAGLPIHAQEDVEGWVAADPFILGRNVDGAFVLKVEGDSMSGDGIADGDYIFVRAAPVAEQGSIVVALIGDEATVKRYRKEEDGTVRLLPSNPAYDPIELRPGELDGFRILGVVTGLFRRL